MLDEEGILGPSCLSVYLGHLKTKMDMMEISESENNKWKWK